MPTEMKSTFGRIVKSLAASLPMVVAAPTTGFAAAEQKRDEEPQVQVMSIQDATVLKNPGKDSAQILWPENAPNAQVTITRVTMQPNAISERHSHPSSEQIWIVEHGSGTLLLGDGRTR